MKDQMTLEEVLTVTNQLLGEISVPVALRSITDGIRHAMDNIQLCIDAIRDNKTGKQEGEDQ